MSVNKLSMARVAVGSLLVGSAPGKKDAPFTTAGGAAVSPVEVAGIRYTSATINPGASIAAASQYTTTVTVNGVQTSDDVELIPPAAIEAGLVWNAYVSAANTITIRVSNITAAAVTTASRTWGFLVIQLPADN